MQLYASAINCQDGRPDWIYLSPHLDDAVFSCGGRIALQVRAGMRVWVVTVCAGSPSGPLSDFAQALHEYWGLAETDAPAARREEDRAALALLGAVPVHWDFWDCIYRRAPDGHFLYPNYDALWGPIAEEDGALREELARRIADLPSSAILCVPLGAGGHVDHRLVRQAAEATGRPLVYYEDYPYAGKPGRVEQALGEGMWRAEEIRLDEAALEAKIAAALCYRSQISSFWADEADLAAHFRDYAAMVGGGNPAERYWEMTNDKMTNDKVTNDKMTNDKVTNDKMTNDKVTNDKMTNDQVITPLQINLSRPNRPSGCLPRFVPSSG